MEYLKGLKAVTSLFCLTLILTACGDSDTEGSTSSSSSKTTSSVSSSGISSASGSNSLGNAANGLAILNDPERCAICHTNEGDGTFSAPFDYDTKNFLYPSDVDNPGYSANSPADIASYLSSSRHKGICTDTCPDDVAAKLWEYKNSGDTSSSISSGSSPVSSSSVSSSSVSVVEPAFSVGLDKLLFVRGVSDDHSTISWTSIPIVLPKLEGGQSVFVDVDLSKTDFIASWQMVDVPTEEGDVGSGLSFTSSNLSLFPVGVFTGQISVNACMDEACTEPLEGSPHIIDTLISITPNKNPDESCPHVPGNLFVDCVDPMWLGASAWEFREDNGLYYPYFEGDNDFLVNWKAIDTNEEGHDTVLDVQFTDAPANGALRFQALGAFDPLLSGADMSAFSTGTIEFDVKVLDWGSNTKGLVAAVECHWPCKSKDFVLDGLELNQWKRFSFAVSEIEPIREDVPFDLSNIDIGLLVAPVWDDMEGVHFQLDNVRWVKGE